MSQLNKGYKREKTLQRQGESYDTYHRWQAFCSFVISFQIFVWPFIYSNQEHFLKEDNRRQSNLLLTLAHFLSFFFPFLFSHLFSEKTVLFMLKLFTQRESLSTAMCAKLNSSKSLHPGVPTQFQTRNLF